MAGMFNGMNNMNSFGAGGGFGGGTSTFGGPGNIFGGNQFGAGAAGFNQFGTGANLFGQNSSFGANTFQRNFFQQKRTQQVEEEEEEEEIEEEIEDEIEEDDEEEETKTKAVNPFMANNPFSKSNSTPFPRFKQKNLNNPFGNFFSQFNQQNVESSEEEEDEEEDDEEEEEEEEEEKPKLKLKTKTAPKSIQIPPPIPRAQLSRTLVPTPTPAPTNSKSSIAQSKKQSSIIEKKESTIKERKDDRDDDYRPRRIARKIRETIIYEDDDDDDDSRRRRKSPNHNESSQTKSVLQQNQSRQNFVPGPVGNRDLRPIGGTGVDLPLAVPTTMKPSSEMNKQVLIKINPLDDPAVKNKKQQKSAFEKKERDYLKSQTYSRDPCKPTSCRERFLKPICLPVCSDNWINTSRQHLSRNRSYKVINEKPIKPSSNRFICVDTSTNKKYQCVAKSSTQPIFYKKIDKQASPSPPPQIQQQPEPSERIFKAALSSSMSTPPLPRLSQRRERINPVPVVKTGSPTIITIPQQHNIYNPISQSSSSKELVQATVSRMHTASPVQIYTAPAGSQFSQNYAEKKSDTEMSIGSVLSNLSPGPLPETVYTPPKLPLAKSATAQVLNERTVTGSSIASILSALAPGRIPDSLYFPPAEQQIEQQDELEQQEQHYALVSDIATAVITGSSADSETRLLTATPIRQTNVEDSQVAVVKSSQQAVTGSSIASILSALAPGRIPDSLFFKSPSSKIVNNPVRLHKTNSRPIVPTVKCQPAPILTKDFCAMVNAALAKIPLNAPVNCYARAIESILSIFGNKYCNTKYRFEISPFTYSTDSINQSGKSSKQSAILPLSPLSSAIFSSAKTLSDTTLSINDSKNLIIDAPPDLSMISIKIENI